MPKPASQMQRRPVQQDVHYTVIVRLPFSRGDFIDPPPVEWDAAKDQTLWRILSQTSQGSDIDWDALAEQFEVTLPFLLQQAAWLYERQLSQVRAQMRKVGNPSVSVPSQVTSTGSPDSPGGAQAMRRAGSGGAGGSRVPSALSTRSRDSPLHKGDTPTDVNARNSGAPMLSRTSSANTIRHALPSSPRTDRPSRVSFSNSQRPRPGSYLKEERAPPQELRHSSPENEDDEDDSNSESGSSSSEIPQTRRSQYLRRAPSLRKQHRAHFGDGSSGSDDGDEDDDGPAFLPFSNPNPPPEPSATVRGKEKATTGQSSRPNQAAIDASHSSTSSDAGLPPPDQPRPLSLARALSSQAPISPRFSPTGGPSSPRRQRAPVVGLKREGSEGTPSLGGGTPSTMGSSFSDLDDASVTQSALEEALASNLQRGGASRLSLLGASLARR